MKKIYIMLIVLLIIFTVQVITYAKENTMSKENSITKEEIIELSRAGARDNVIIMHIKARCCSLLEITDMKELIDAGVSLKVVDFIIDYQGKMPAYCENSEKYMQLQELKEQLRTKYKFEKQNNKNIY